MFLLMVSEAEKFSACYSYYDEPIDKISISTSVPDEWNDTVTYWSAYCSLKANENICNIDK